MRLHPAPARLLVPVLTAALLLLGAAACSGDDDDAGGDATTTTAAADTGGDENAVVAEGIAFANDLTLAPGAEFVLDNEDSTVHTLTADDGSFDSQDVAAGARSEPMTAPDAPGTYDFHCEIHSSMTGTITVE
jgi:plastocyanin